MDTSGPGEADRPGIDPQHETTLLEAILQHQIGIDPHRVDPVLDLAAIGLVNAAWRNGPVEDWHVQGRLSDGDMLRINAATTHRVQQIIRRWRAELGLTADTPLSVLDTLPAPDIDLVAYRVWCWLDNPNRQLATGTTLAAVAGDDLGAYRDHAELELDVFADLAAQRGPRYAVWRTAAYGGLTCRHW